MLFLQSSSWDACTRMLAWSQMQDSHALSDHLNCAGIIVPGVATGWLSWRALLR